MKSPSIIAGVLTGFVFLTWKLIASGDFTEALGIGLLTGTAVEWIMAFYTKKDLEISQNDLYERSLMISKTLRDME